MRNLNKNMMERGGLMIEALAMLGLIAVVTPTMYKKSAERTLEVEDINTATTVRTYMNAVEAFMSNEYGTLVGQPELNEEGAIADPDARRGFFYESADDTTLNRPIGSRDFHGNEGDPVLALSSADLEPYLPYHFETNNPLYDYGEPQARVVKNGNNLTAFVQFPARQGQADGIGQERTARIASLVGATGGYVLSDGQQARGVGGIWNLDSNNMTALFGGAGNPYSLVTASANVAMDVNGGQLDNDKYLQRTREDDSTAEGDELWRNTMRTDLYMGGNLDDNSNETQNTAGQDNDTKHSIRSILSMIVGAEKAPEVGRVDDDGNPVNDTEGHQIMDEVQNYGLYIHGSDHGADSDSYADAYIGGALEAIQQGLYVSHGRMVGEGDGPAEGAVDGEGNPIEDTRYRGAQFLFGDGDGAEYRTEIRGDGDIYNEGYNGILFDRMMQATDGAAVQIGGEYGITMDYTPAGADPWGENVLDIALGNTVQIGEHGKATNGATPSNVYDTFVNVFTNDDEDKTPWGYRTTTNNSGIETEVADGKSLVKDMYVTTKTTDGVTTTTGTVPNFPMSIGANTKVEGTLAAAQMDTNKLRAAKLEAGSKKVGDEKKWLVATESGVTISDIDQGNPDAEPPVSGTGPHATFKHEGISMYTDKANLHTHYSTEIDTYGGGAYFALKGSDGNSRAELGTQLSKEGNRGTRVQVIGGNATGSDAINFVFDSGRMSSGMTKNSKLSITSSDMNDNTITVTAKRDDYDWRGDLILTAEDGSYNVGDDTVTESGRVTIKSNKMRATMGAGEGNEFVISSEENNGDSPWAYDHRTRVIGGWLDLENSGLNVMAVDPTGKQYRNSPIFTVRSGSPDVYGGDSQSTHSDQFSGRINNDPMIGESDQQYLASMHGPFVFTDFVSKDGIQDKDYTKLMSIGSFNKDAGVNIVADDNLHGTHTFNPAPGVTETIDQIVPGGRNILLIDQMNDAAEREDVVSSYSKDSVTGSYSGRYTVDPGTIYMRKGMVEVVSDVSPAVGSSTDYSAKQGSGIVQASRFVANNVDSTGNLVEVPTLFNSTVYSTYNGANGSDGNALQRYDTYMVNPAYTSVMHDIKLTTRGGARLSDILPDFINKGIYVANNTVAESSNGRSMKFTLGEGLTVSGFESMAGVNDPASPFMGAVPAPQCPPGYGRVITVSPVSFQMGQAGRPRWQTLGDGKKTIYAAAEDVLPQVMKSAGKGAEANEDNYKKLVDNEDDESGVDGGAMSPSHTTKYRELQWDTTGVVLKATVTSSEGDEGEKTISNISNTAVSSDGEGLMYVHTPITKDGTNAHARAYVLGVATSDTDNLYQPLTFQQSTFLKTAAVPLVQNCQTQFGWGQGDIATHCGANSYVRAWAILMGFIYPESTYGALIHTLGVDIFSDQSSAGDGMGPAAFYWNVFPVLREHLEAYATVYCYYDRTNLYGDNANTGGVQYVDPYDYLASPPTSYERQQETTEQQNYIKRLNDPSMKYNEVW